MYIPENMFINNVNKSKKVIKEFAYRIIEL